MGKVALLIGVSEYELGLNPLPGAKKDIEAMQRVLQHPEMGGFAEVKLLANPNRQEIDEGIETLFAGRDRNDLVLLYFSGHGIKDDSGKLYLATSKTRKDSHGELMMATAVAASSMQGFMSRCRSKRQVVILDCCFSGAFGEGWVAKSDDSVDISQLGSEGRVVLTSSGSIQYSFEQEGGNLSTYTRFLVEGIETGAADRDTDGMISVDELHEYARRKVHEAKPAMKPERFVLRGEGEKILLAKAPTGDPKLSYRRETEIRASHGEISDVGRRILNRLREDLKLSTEDARAIEAQVLKPYQERQKKLQLYKRALVAAIQSEKSLRQETQNELRRYQEVLGLRDLDVAPIKAQFLHEPVIPVVQPVKPDSVPSGAGEVVPEQNKQELSPPSNPIPKPRKYTRLLIGIIVAIVLVPVGLLGTSILKSRESPVPPATPSLPPRSPDKRIISKPPSSSSQTTETRTLPEPPSSSSQTTETRTLPKPPSSSVSPPILSHQFSEDFENPDPGWFPAGGAGFDYGKALAHQGAGNAWVRNNNGWNAINHFVEVSPRTNCTASAWLRMSPLIKGYMSVRNDKEGKTGNDDLINEMMLIGPAEEDYRYYRFNFFSGDNTRVLFYVGFWGNGSDSWIQVDDVVISCSQV